MNGTTLAVDLGNSAIKLAWTGPGEPQPLAVQRIAIDPQHAWIDRALEVVRQRSTGVSGAPATPCLVASTHRSAWERLEPALASASPRLTVHRITWEQVPVVSEGPTPASVGIDRLLGAWAAAQLSPGAAAVVVDAGTAVTVDLVDPAGRFCGGAILPGLRMQMASLHQRITQLPSLSESALETASLPAPGIDTAGAIRVGVVLGLVGAIERIAQSYRQGAAEPLSLFLTGGDAPALLPHFSRSVHPVPDLVLGALARLASGVAAVREASS